MSRADDRDRELRRKIKKAVKRASDAEEAIQNVQHTMSNRPRTKKERKAKQKENATVYAAPLGIKKIVIERHSKEGVLVRVDGFPPPIDLGGSRILPAMIKALCRKGPKNDAAGQFVPLKSAAQVINDVQSQIEVKMTRETFRTQLWLLREYVEGASLHRNIVETVKGRQGGFRMLLTPDGEVEEVVIED